MSKVFKVGLIGCGHIAETYFRAHKYFNNFQIIKCADINKKNIHNSVESLQRERGVGLTPMQKANAERMLRENQQIYRNHILEKQHTSNLQTNQYQEKNKKWNFGELLQVATRD